MSDYGASEDLRCDFFACGDQFDQRKNRNVAIVKDGIVLAFCAKDAKRLIEAGVQLRPLSEIHAEMSAPIKERKLRTIREREEAFINSLKS